MSPQIANNIRVEVAAATAVLNYDLLKDHRDNRVPYARKIDGISLVGSAAAGDTKVEIRIEGKTMLEVVNSATGVAVDRKRDVQPLNIFVPANNKIEAIVTDAPLTNPIALTLELDKPEYSGSRRFFRKSNYSGGGRRLGGFRRSSSNGFM